MLIRESTALTVATLSFGAAALQLGLPATQPAVCRPQGAVVQYLPMPEVKLISPAPGWDWPIVDRWLPPEPSAPAEGKVEKTDEPTEEPVASSKERPRIHRARHYRSRRRH